MSEHNNPKLNERELEMIIDHALGQDHPGEQQRPDEHVLSEIEHAAALLDISIATSNPVDLPTDLADRIKARVSQYPDQSNASKDTPNESDLLNPYQFPQESSPEIAPRRWIPWMVAAASLFIATISILTPRGIQSVRDLNAERLAMIENTPAELLTQWDWISTDDAAVVGDVIGDVVWSDTLNKGFMRISGLAINDPSLNQYQLWIFDATNPTGDLPQFGEGLLTQRPIDGGVFDVSSDSEIIIEIHAKLIVEQAAAFAVTVEPPGGVVVSDRSRVPLLALAP
jgi:hypothetical protein